MAALNEKQVDLICMAGYMRLLSPLFIRAFPNRILNIHPSLLPSFPGLDAQKQAIEYGVKVSGCTVHFVDEHLDHGAIVVQRAVPVDDTDDDHSLAARILVQEHLAYTEAINIVLRGNYEIVGRRVVEKKAMAAAALAAFSSQPLAARSSACLLFAYTVSMLKVKLLVPTAKAPTVAHPGEDLGYDVYAAADDHDFRAEPWRRLHRDRDRDHRRSRPAHGSAAARQVVHGGQAHGADRRRD